MELEWSLNLEEAFRLRKASPEEIESFQLEALKRHLKQATKSPYYKKLFKELDFSPEEISSLAELAQLPLTERKALEEDWKAFLAIPEREIADISFTSGTTTKPLIIVLSRRDLERLAFNEALAFAGAGLRAGEKALITITLDQCFIAGLAYFSGLLKLGVAAIRSGPGNVLRQLELIKDLFPETIIGVPSFLRHLALKGKEQGYDLRKMGVKQLIVIGEPVRDASLKKLPLGKDLEELWGAQVVSTYAATELQTCFCECALGCGGHIHPELAIVEIVDEDGKPLPPGKPGEVVVTPLGVEAMPLVRYRTGDVARLHTQPCECGWYTWRLGPIKGRLAQKLKIKGTTVYPEAILAALRGDERIGTAYLEIRSTFDFSDEVKVVVGVYDPKTISYKELASRLKSKIRVTPEIEIRPYAEVMEYMLKHGGRKPKKFFDLRKGYAEYR